MMHINKMIRVKYEMNFFFSLIEFINFRNAFIYDVTTRFTRRIFTSSRSNVICTRMESYYLFSNTSVSYFYLIYPKELRMNRLSRWITCPKPIFRRNRFITVLFKTRLFMSIVPRTVHSCYSIHSELLNILYSLENLDVMFNTGLFINDLSMHDSSRDLVLAGTQQSAELKLALDQVIERSFSK